MNIAYNGCCICTQRDKLKLVYQVGDGTDEAAVCLRGQRQCLCHQGLLRRVKWRQTASTLSQGGFARSRGAQSGLCNASCTLFSC